MNSNIKTFVEDSETLLINKKKELEKTYSRIIKFFEDNILDKINKDNLLLHGRVKKGVSLREKIIRKNYHKEYETPTNFIATLPDIIGIRIICLLKDEEEQIYNELRELFTKENDEYYYIDGKETDSLHINFKKNQPEKQKNGNDIYRIACKWVDQTGKVTNVELQIKSLVHMFWGEIEHMLFYKNYSYTIGVDFYKKVIESTYNMLTSIDSQLKVMKQQMFIDEEEAKIAQIKQIMTKFLYSFFNENFINSHGCKIDLREAYELIIQLKFDQINETKEATKLTQSLLHKLTEEKEIITPNLCLNNNSRHLARNLKTLNDEDAFWSAFFIMYANVIIEGDEVVLNQVTAELMRNFLAIFDSSQYSHTPLFKQFKSSMLDGLILAFLKYKKMDFFLRDMHGKFIESILGDFLLKNEKYINDWQPEEFNDQKLDNQFKLIALWIESLILAKLKRDELVTVLKELRSIIESGEIISPLNIDIVKLIHLIKSAPVGDITYHQLVNIVDNNEYGGEDNDN
ncbi:hypothetical protein O0Q50_08115 [Priestia aryabhattai]|uniref:RelA/SpoT domain-containing protein n=1 Tax=Priestia aryabhattai TaxID=412384 RepID=A0AAX6N5G2_PRIAR|nr:hypothetical protein [Priestia aryabhattai]MDU9691128.1 hypothetical protein [Priestia aryabhattai]